MYNTYIHIYIYIYYIYNIYIYLYDIMDFDEFRTRLEFGSMGVILVIGMKSGSPNKKALMSCHESDDKILTADYCWVIPNTLW